MQYIENFEGTSCKIIFQNS